MFLYCPKCALIKNLKASDSSCEACDVPMQTVPKRFLSASGLLFASQAARKEFEAMIREDAAYDADADAQKEGILSAKAERRRQELAEKTAAYQDSRHKLVCPLCQPASLAKISNVGKVVKVGTLGILGAGDIGKTWKCKACGYRF